jgi:hypothetical protein
MGAGNSTMQMAISEQLLSMRNLFDPDPQREILREVTFNITGDAAKAQAWVPDAPVQVTDSVHDAQLACGTLMQGLPMSVKTGMNHQEYVVTLIGNLKILVQGIEQNGGMATQEQINGFINIAKYAGEHLQILSQDPTQKSFVADAQKQLSKIMNLVRAFDQRLKEQQQKAQEQQGQQQDPAAAAKAQGQIELTKQKLDGNRQLQAQKMAQSAEQFKMEQQQRQEEFDAEQHRKTRMTILDHSRGMIEENKNTPTE